MEMMMRACIKADPVDQTRILEALRRRRQTVEELALYPELIDNRINGWTTPRSFTEESCSGSPGGAGGSTRLTTSTSKPGALVSQIQRPDLPSGGIRTFLARKTLASSLSQSNLAGLAVMQQIASSSPQLEPASDLGRLASLVVPRPEFWDTNIREARGFLSLRTRQTGGKSVDAMISLHRNMLTIHMQSLPGGAFDQRRVSIPVDRLIVTIRQLEFEMLFLSCSTEASGEILCVCKDQTARNKWLYIFRRVKGVKVYPMQPLIATPCPAAGPCTLQRTHTT